jgi:hypothetical protein
MSNCTQSQQAFEIALRERLEADDDRLWRLEMAQVKRYFSDEVEDEAKRVEQNSTKEKETVRAGRDNVLPTVRQTRLSQLRPQAKAAQDHDRR